jgi:26S proteasome regulatory subunit N9
MNTAGGAKEYIDQKAVEDPARYGELADLYDKRLWHQLTQCVVALVEHWQETGVQSEEALAFYYRFLRDFETRLNPLSLTQVVIGLSRLVHRQNARNAAAFLRECLGEKAPVEHSVAARTLYLSELIRLLLRTGDDSAVDEAKRLLAEASSLVAATTGTLDPAVSSAYYRAASDYYKAIGSAGEFYHHALAFLSCTPIEVLSEAERVEWALDIGMAALLGKDTYNLGEVLQCDVVRALAEQDERKWFHRLLQAVEIGDIDEFERIMEREVTEPRLQELLRTNRATLSQKIRLLCFTRMASFDAVYAGKIPFSAAAKECRVTLDEVEHMVMKAFSECLVQGSIDQVDGTITVSRVRPRVLDRQDVSKMIEYLKAWEMRTDEMLQSLQTEAQELITPS